LERGKKFALDRRGVLKKRRSAKSREKKKMVTCSAFAEMLHQREQERKGKQSKGYGGGNGEKKNASP